MNEKTECAFDYVDQKNKAFFINESTGGFEKL